MFEGDVDFAYDVSEHAYIESEDYLDWVHEQDVTSMTFEHIMTLRKAFPCK